MRRATFTLFCLAAIAVAGCSADADRSDSQHMSLAGPWKFHPGDDLAWAQPGHDDSEWATLRVPGAWGQQGYEDLRVGWYRLTIEPPGKGSAKGPQLGLRLGHISTGYEAYAGGTKIGAVGGPPPDLQYDRHAVWEIPHAALEDDGTLVLALRVWSSEALGRRSGGISGPPVEVGPLQALTYRFVIQNLPELLLAALFLGVAFYHLELFRQRHEQREYLWYGLFVLVDAVHTFSRSQWRFLITDDYLLLKEIEYLAVFSLFVLGIQFLWILVDARIGLLLRLYQFSNLALAVLVVATPGLELNLRVMSWWGWWAAPGFVAAVWLIWRRAWQGHRDARTIGLATAVLVGTYIHDILAVNDILSPPYWGTYGFALFILSMALVLAHRFGRLHRDLDGLRLGLERKVEQRTHELQEALGAAEAADHAKGEFLANMSHEIRTPLNGVIGLAGLLRKSELGSQETEYVDKLHSSADILLQLVNDILDFSKIEAGETHLEARTFQIDDILADLEEVFTPRAAAKSIELRIDTENGFASVSGDPHRLRQVLINLVGNAVKFTKEGYVSVTVRDLGTDDGGSNYRFEVRDTGIGIDPETRVRLFDPFTQADSSTNRRFGGTGLGLSISKSLVGLMGGRIGVDSSPTPGTVFWFEVPLPRAQAAVALAPESASPQVRQPSAGDRPSTLLIAEDNPVNRLLLVRQVSLLGYQTETAETGREALELSRDNRFDLILMDCQMPDLDGYEATRRIRREEGEGQRPRVPIVAVTASAIAGDRQRCIDAGMDDYLTKPFTDERLGAVIERWLEPTSSR